MSYKKFNKNIRRDSIQLLPFEIKQIVKLRYGCIKRRLESKPLNTIKEIALKAGVKVPTVNSILMKYRNNNYSVDFISKRSFNRPKKLGNFNIVNALTSKILLREWAHHLLLRRY